MLKVTKLFLFESCIKAMQSSENNDAYTKTLLSKGRQDSYVAGENSVYVIYGRNAKINTEKKGEFSGAVLDAINFNYWKMWRNGVKETDTSLTYGDVKYLKSEIPQVDLDKCLEIKAENNRVIFTSGNYYGFHDSSGNFHALACACDMVGQPYSELLVNKANDISYRVGQFWNLLSWDGTYIGLYYSREEERKMLNDAGITEGFFSVEVGSQKCEYFYSNGRSGTSVLKERYDERYESMFTDTWDWWWLTEYEPGSVFKIGGKDYVLSEDRKLDVPYGVDIYDVQYPPRIKK